MKRFLNGSEQAYRELADQARRVAFIQFRDAELPPGCVPSRQRIGVKVEPTTGATLLYVELGVRYYGADSTARRFFETGELAFPTFDALRAWLTQDLKSLFDTPVDIQAPLGEASEENIQSSGPCVPIANPSPEALAPPPAAPATPLPATSKQLEKEAALERFVEGIIEYHGEQHGVQVIEVEPALSKEILRELRAGPRERTLGECVEEIAGGALSLAALQGHSMVIIRAGPPVNCVPAPSNPTQTTP